MTWAIVTGILGLLALAQAEAWLRDHWERCKARDARLEKQVRLGRIARQRQAIAAERETRAQEKLAAQLQAAVLDHIPADFYALCTAREQARANDAQRALGAMRRAVNDVAQNRGGYQYVPYPPNEDAQRHA